MSAASAKQKQAIPDARRGNLFWVDPDSIEVVTDKESPLYDPRAEWPPDEELVSSIRNMGVLEPVALRRNGESFEVVFGRRRVIAARELNRRIREGSVKAEDGSKMEPILVPSIAWRGTDQQARLALLAENVVRRDDVPSVVAQKLQQAVNLGCQETDLAQALGVSVDTIRNKLRLLDLHPAVLKAVDAGTFGEVLARKLIKLPREEQKAALDKLVEEGTTKGSKARKKVEERTNGDSKETGGRRLSRSECNKWLDELARNDGEFGGLVVSVLRYVLGDRDALGGRYRGYRPKFFDE